MFTGETVDAEAGVVLLPTEGNVGRIKRRIVPSPYNTEGVPLSLARAVNAALVLERIMPSVRKRIVSAIMEGRRPTSDGLETGRRLAFMKGMSVAYRTIIDFFDNRRIVRGEPTEYMEDVLGVDKDGFQLYDREPSSRFRRQFIMMDWADWLVDAILAVIQRVRTTGSATAAAVTERALLRRWEAALVAALARADDGDSLRGLADVVDGIRRDVARLVPIQVEPREVDRAVRRGNECRRTQEGQRVYYDASLLVVRAVEEY